MLTNSQMDRGIPKIKVTLPQQTFGYGSIPIDTCLVGWTSIYQLFWGSLGTRVLTHPHFGVLYNRIFGIFGEGFHTDQLQMEHLFWFSIPSGMAVSVLAIGRGNRPANAGKIKQINEKTITDWCCNNHLEKYEFVNGKDYPIYEMENKTCSKPPTRLYNGSHTRAYYHLIRKDFWLGTSKALGSHGMIKPWGTDRDLAQKGAYVTGKPRAS